MIVKPSILAILACTTAVLADTVQFQLFSSGDCSGSAFETANIGTVEACHGAEGQVNSFRLNVGQSFFGQGIHWFFSQIVSGEVCSGQQTIGPLQNNVCFSVQPGFSERTEPAFGFGLTRDGECINCDVIIP
ncbi:hypothetical protein F5884DRAFT_406840 [Xylogone sp. PMI_703]|nr:hypothetical protein F5884DRAFT_406840 [Xylogone sp. PMI_703]